MMKKTTLSAAAIISACAITLFGGGVAFAAEGDSVLVNPNPVLAGETVTLSGASCFDGEGTPGVVYVGFADTDVNENVAANSEGGWTIEIVIPAEWSAGTYNFTATCNPEGSDANLFAYADGTVTVSEESEVEIFAEIGEITRDGCLVSIPVYTSPGSFVLEIWDDGELIQTFSWDSAEGGTHVVQWTITGPAGGDSSGVGILVFSADDDFLDERDPYEYPAEVGIECAPTPPVDPTPPAKIETAAAGSMGGVSIPGIAGVATLLSVGLLVGYRRKALQNVNR